MNWIGTPSDLPPKNKWQYLQGSSQTFEIRDLVVPAGTDWSSKPLVIGDLVQKAQACMIACVYLELEAIPAADDQLWFQIDDVEQGSTAADAIASVAGGLSYVWGAGTQVDNIRHAFRNNVGIDEHLEDVPLEFRIWSNHALTDDIKINLAYGSLIAV